MDLAVGPRRMSEAAFLAWAAPRKERWEYDGTGPVAKPDDTVRHGIIQANLVAALGNRLRGGGCHVLGSGIFVRAGASLRLPDALVICRDIQPDNRVIEDPVAIFEILSAETDYIDRYDKSDEYDAIPSLRDYVMLDERFRGIVALTRVELGWERDTAVGAQDLVLPGLDLTLPLAAIFEAVEFPPPTLEPGGA
jgi:Uma2 family endonuclease